MSKTLAEILEEKFIPHRNMDAPLADRLQSYASDVRRLNPLAAEAADRLVERLMTSGAGNMAPKIGDRLPSFILPDDQGRLISLEDILKKGPAAISFHRGYWCPYCRINIHALALAEEKVRAKNCQIVAIVPERQKFSAWLKSDVKAAFPVLSDMDNGYAMSLGLAIWVGDEMMAVMKAAGKDISLSQGSDSWMLPIPATFVVGTNGIIVARFVDPDYRMRMAIDDMIAALTMAQ